MKLSRKMIITNIIPLSIFLIGSLLSLVIVQKDQNTTQHFIDTYSTKEEKLYEIYQSLGYGGGIHSFKNYILRFDKQYYLSAKDKLNTTIKLINEYLLLPEKTLVEKEAMQTLLSTIALYLQKLDTANKLIKNHKDQAQIDHVVKVDDGPAIKAIEDLRRKFSQDKNLELLRIEQSQKYALRVFLFTILLTILVAILMNSLFLKKILMSLKKVNELSLSIAKSNYNHDYAELAHLSDDELKEIGQQLISLGLHLKIAFENLERSNKDLSQFAFVASHDMQGPAKKLYSYSELLELSCKDQLNEQGRSYINAIKDSSQRLIDLVRALLNYSNINMDIKKEHCELEKIISNIKEDLAQKILESKTSLDYNQLPTVYAQPQLIHSLFYNLISNAIKYRKNDQPNQIFIKVQETAARWNFEIIDNGIGFDMKHLDTILRPFGRLHHKNDIPGLGIGLPLCQKIVKAHGSIFEIYSTEGEGTNIQFSLSKAS